MVPILGLKFKDHEEMKMMLANYGVANGYQLWYKRNDYKSLLVLCGRNVKEGRCASKVGRKGKSKEKVAEGKGKEGKGKEKVAEGSKVAKGSKVAEGGLIEHYGKLWDYRDHLLKTNPGSTVKLDIEEVLRAKTYFRSYGAIYVDVAMKDGWTEGCRKVIGLDGCFLKGTIKGELLTAMGRDGMFPIAWVVVTVENSTSGYGSLYDLNLNRGATVTIISDGHK
ncbi:hypothetical protein Tco_0699030, partial [Tanacetum coccineum]